MPSCRATHGKTPDRDPLRIDRVLAHRMLERFEGIDLASQLVGVAVASEGMDHQHPFVGQRIRALHAGRKELEFETFLAATTAPHIGPATCRYRGLEHDPIRLNRTVELRTKPSDGDVGRTDNLRPVRKSIPTERFASAVSFVDELLGPGEVGRLEETVFTQRKRHGSMKDFHIRKVFLNPRFFRSGKFLDRLFQHLKRLAQRFTNLGRNLNPRRRYRPNTGDLIIGRPVGKRSRRAESHKHEHPHEPKEPQRAKEPLYANQTKTPNWILIPHDRSFHSM